MVLVDPVGSISYGSGKEHTKIQIWSHLLKKSLIESFIFCTMSLTRVKTKFSFDLVILVK